MKWILAVLFIILIALLQTAVQVWIAGGIKP
jgi:hypothetical protein